MKISDSFPPNIQDIRARLVVHGDVIFCYGDTIYNPSKKELTEDLIVHEQVHSEQQGNLPDVWWFRYLNDDGFRLSQEIEAYGAQYALVKSKTHGTLREWILDRMADALSGDVYGNLLTFAEAKSKIRNYEK